MARIHLLHSIVARPAAGGVLLAVAFAACVVVPPGTTTGDLAAVSGEPPLVLSAPPRSAGGGTAAARWRGASRDADLAHVVIDLSLDLEAQRVIGEVALTFEALREGTEEIGLHAADMEIREVQDGAGRALAFRRRGDDLRVTLDAPVAKGDQATVVTRFTAVPGRGFRTSLMKGDVFAPQAFGAGEPDGLRWWLPLWDQPGDLTSVDTTVRVRDDLSAIANGVLVEVDTDMGGARSEEAYTWRQQVPIPVRAIAVAAGRFETFASEAGSTELYFHLPAGTDEVSAQRTFGETAALVTYLELRLDRPFPFPRYDQAALRDLPQRTLDGASLTLLDDKELVSVEDELDDLRERPRRIVARSLARKWFGVWLAPLEERHRWLLDGLAMQLELDYEARVRGEPEVALEWEELREKIARRSRESVAAVDDLSREERAERAGWAVRVLRTRLGEESFLALVRDFVRADADGSVARRVVTAEDFRRAALDTLGVDIGPELAQWAGRRTVPELRVRFQRRAVQGVGESIGVVVDQVQPGPAFRIDLPIVVHFADGSTHVDTLSISDRSDLLIVPITERVVDVSVDPDGLLLAEFDVEKDDDAWLAQGALGRTSIDRVRAIPELERMAAEDERARQALIQILLQSPEPALRERCTRSMRFEGPACTLALQRAASEDASPLVRRAALHSLIQLYAQGRWEPTGQEVERMLALQQRETSPGVLRKLEELLETIPAPE
ncbi:MAG: hypothetical protein AAGB93_13380 [Planctomycetota bacterium]